VTRPPADPPRWLRRLASSLVRGPDAPYDLGDLDEGHARERSTGSSRWRSGRRYLRNAVGSALSLAWAPRRLPRVARRAILQLTSGIMAGLALWWVLDHNLIRLSGDTSLHAPDLPVLFAVCAGGTLVVGLLACLPPCCALRIRPVEVLRKV
jgi:hypothetical protein